MKYIGQLLFKANVKWILAGIILTIIRSWNRCITYAVSRFMIFLRKKKSIYLFPTATSCCYLHVQQTPCKSSECFFFYNKKKNSLHFSKSSFDFSASLVSSVRNVFHYAFFFQHNHVHHLFPALILSAFIRYLLESHI